MQFLIGIGGIALILAIAVLFSSNRRWIRLRVVGAAFALQAVIAVLVLGTPWGQRVIGAMSTGVSNLLGYAKAGTDFIFGPLASPEMGANSFAIAALPVIIFFASLISILYYLGIMQLIIKWVGGAIRLVTGITRVESLGSAANIFVGQSESPLVIKPYLANLTPSQLFCVMTVGMAGRRRHHPRRLCQHDRPAPAALPARRQLHVGAGRHPDGQDHHARRSRRRGDLEPEPVDEAEHGEEKPANIIMAAAHGRADRRQAGGRGRARWCSPSSP